MNGPDEAGQGAPARAAAANLLGRRARGEFLFGRVHKLASVPGETFPKVQTRLFQLRNPTLSPLLHAPLGFGPRFRIIIFQQSTAPCPRMMSTITILP
jgi:hypothetical protein